MESSNKKMDDKKILDIFKAFDPNTLLKLEGLNISKTLKQLENLKLSGLLEKMEDMSKLIKMMDEMKLSELVKKMEEIKLSTILKQIEDKKFPELLDKFPNPVKTFMADDKEIGDMKNVTIHKHDSIPEQIKKLAELRELGIISNDEFQSKKRQLLDRM